MQQYVHVLCIFHLSVHPEFGNSSLDEKDVLKELQHLSHPD